MVAGMNAPTIYNGGTLNISWIVKRVIIKTCHWRYISAWLCFQKLRYEQNMTNLYNCPIRVCTLRPWIGTEKPSWDPKWYIVDWNVR